MNMNIQDYIILQQGSGSKTLKQKIFTFLMMIYMSYQNDFKTIIIYILEKNI